MTYRLSAVAGAFAFWLMDAHFEWLALQFPYELYPDDNRVLFLRLTVVALIFAIGYISDHFEFIKKVQVHEKSAVFQATLRSTQHIVNNLLNQLLVLKLGGLPKASDEALYQKRIDQIIADNKMLLEQLCEVKSLDPAVIQSSVAPQSDNQFLHNVIHGNRT